MRMIVAGWRLRALARVLETRSIGPLLGRIALAGIARRLR
jgi:hypothetical protein